MNKPSGKGSALKHALQQQEGTAKLRVRIDWRLIVFAAATICLVGGVFLAWQSYLLLQESAGAEQAQRVRDWEVDALGTYFAELQGKVQQALGSAPVLQALTTGGDGARAAAISAVKQQLPAAEEVEFYDPSIAEVMSSDSDWAKFGYAKAGMLVQAHRLLRPAPVQSQGKDKRSLMLAQPVKNGTNVVAFAFVKMPFDPVRDIFTRPAISAAQVDLRQGDGRGDLKIMSIGSASRDSLNDPGVAVPSSSFRIGSSVSELFVVTPRSLLLLLPLVLILFVLGGGLLWLRVVGPTHARTAFQRKQQASPVHEPTLAESMGPAAPAPRAKASVGNESKRPARKEHPEVNLDRSIFRAYDIRGVLDKTLTPAIARLIGRAIGSEVQERGLKDIIVARDGRLSGPDLAAALIEGLRAAGCDVIDIGAAPTPVLYFATFHLNTGSGVMVTGSHNPPDYNGFKIVIGGETLAEGAIQNLFARISESRFSSGSGGLQSMDVSQDYIDRITGDVQIEHRLKVVVDCGNGIPGAIAPAVLTGIGCEVLPMYCEVDGTFPNHHPDPSDPHNLQDLILSVKQLNADLGIAFDGDGDRLGVVTKSGEIIFPDRVLMLFAMDVLTRSPGAVIIYDVKCTGNLQPLILKHGGSPIMWKTGHSLIKAKMRETDAELAGEMSGHFFFRERWYGFDDGIYAAARLLEILAGDLEGRDAQAIFDRLPRGVSTPELKIDMPEGEHYRFVERFKEKATFEGARVTTIDGVRADYPDGWGLVRASNTTPILVLRFDASNDVALKRIKDTFRRQLLALEPSLTMPF